MLANGLLETIYEEQIAVSYLLHALCRNDTWANLNYGVFTSHFNINYGINYLKTASDDSSGEADFFLACIYAQKQQSNLSEQYFRKAVANGFLTEISFDHFYNAYMEHDELPQLQILPEFGGKQCCHSCSGEKDVVEMPKKVAQFSIPQSYFETKPRRLCMEQSPENVSPDSGVYTGTAPATPLSERLKNVICTDGNNNSHPAVKRKLYFPGDENADPNKAAASTSDFLSRSLLSNQTKDQSVHTSIVPPVKTLHSKTIPTVKLFRCKVENCQKLFNNRLKLNRHAATHSDNRPYSCSQCSLSYKRPDHRSRHFKKTHAKENTFQ